MDDWIIRLVEKASTVSERTGPNFCQARPPDDEAAASRLETWRQRVAVGDGRRFDGASNGTASMRIRFGRLSTGYTGIAGRLRSGLESSASIERMNALERGRSAGVGPGQENGGVSAEEPLPFEDILLPFLSVAGSARTAVWGPSRALLSPRAHATLDRSLMVSLCSLCSKAVECPPLRLQEPAVLVRRLNSSCLIVARDLYHSFVQVMRDGRLHEFFLEYAVLARLAGLSSNSG